DDRAARLDRLGAVRRLRRLLRGRARAARPRGAPDRPPRPADLRISGTAALGLAKRDTRAIAEGVNSGEAVRGAIEAFNSGDFEAVLECVHPEIEVIRLGGLPTVTGRE